MAAPNTAAQPLLEVRDLRVSYGAIEALKGISLVVAEREIVTLIGANGAGKSTTLRAIMGLVPLAAGSVSFRGESLVRMPTHRIVERKLAMVPEGRAVFANMTVAENLELGAFTRRDKDGIAADMARVLTIFPRLEERHTQSAGTLSGGEQQMLAIGRALMLRPQFLLLDEPSLGLAPILVHAIFAAIEEINRAGTSILLVEQNAHAALEHSRRAYVLETGAILLAGESKALAADPRVKKAYLGE